MHSDSAEATTTSRLNTTGNLWLQKLAPKRRTRRHRKQVRVLFREVDPAEPKIILVDFRKSELSAAALIQ